MTTIRPVLVLAAVAAIVVARPVAAQVFEPWEGPDTVQQGTGGTKKVVNEVDVWTVGTPSCPFRILGYVHDVRRRLDLFGLAGMTRIEAAVTQVARAHGGDAVYLVSSDSRSVGGIGAGVGAGQGSYHEHTTVSGNTASTRGSGVSTGVSLGLGADIKKTDSRYAVLKCVEDAPPVQPTDPAPAPAAAAAPPEAGGASPPDAPPPPPTPTAADSPSPPR
jgi:hypothetical protein